MGPKTFKRLLYGIVLAIVAGIAVLALRPAPVPVDVAEARRDDLVVTVDEEGRTRVHEVYVVSAPVAGRVLRIEHDVGDEVIAGETVLARILPSAPPFLDARTEAERRAAVEAAEASQALALAQVERARAERAYAKAEYDRAVALYENRNVSPAAVDRARMAYTSSEAALHTAEAAVRVARSDLARARAALMEPGAPAGSAPRDPADGAGIVTLHAPVSGRVLRVLRQSETVVVAGEGLIEVGDPRDLEIVADLLSVDAVGVAEGAAVTITGWGGPALAGRVRRVEPFGFTKISALGVEEQRVNVVIDFISPRQDWHGLGHGFRVEVAIERWRGTDVLQVPLSALFRSANAWAVFVHDAGRARLTPVTIGHLSETAAQVVDGLDAGAVVVLHPGASIGDGTRLVLRPGT